MKFEVKLEDYLLSENSTNLNNRINSGIQFWSTMENDIRMTGPQIEIDRYDFGGIYGENMNTGWLKEPNNSNLNITWNTHDYNIYHVVVENNKVRISINNSNLSDMTWTPPQNIPTTGRIGIQIHSPYTLEQHNNKKFISKILSSKNCRDVHGKNSPAWIRTTVNRLTAYDPNL